MADNSPPASSPGDALARHWPEYLIEATLLGLFMVSACMFTALLEHPSSPLRQAIPDGVVRRVLTGVAMGLTAIALIHSPLGKRSGAHMNPSFTLTFARLGKVAPWDAFFYMAAQFAGGVAGVVVSWLVLRQTLAHPNVNYAVTLPGPDGPAIAFLGEVVISFLLMTMVLITTNHPRLSHYTGIFAGLLLATYISVEAPLSGMSMNPARTLGSALPAAVFDSLWLYFLAPPLGMLLAAETYVRWKGARSVLCAKYHHHNTERCIFRCRFGEMANGG
ncbi:MAG TPA: aquaporin [Terriglobales bacterium]|nr:aquaporin [Terriglobales bacterium]